jgi:succinate dehydrogenase / fumarate reductase flavoprotein subunit
MGCPFARTPSGELDQRFFGAHTYRRTCYAGDYIGRAMLYTLADKVAELGIPIHEQGLPPQASPFSYRM